MSDKQTLNPNAARAQALLKALHETRPEVENLLVSLSPEDLEQPTICEGWNVRAQIGHMIDATEMQIRTLEQAAAGNHEGIFRPRQMAGDLAKSAITRADNLALSELTHAFETVAALFLSLLDSRSLDSWEEGIPHQYIGTIPAFMVPGVILLDWFIHPYDIQAALGRPPEPHPDHTALIAAGLVGLLPRRVNLKEAEGLKGRFRFLVEKEGDSQQFVSRLDAVLDDGKVTVEREVSPEIPADLTFKGRAGDMVLSLMGRKPLANILQPGPGNATWLPRWPNLWISL